MNTTHTSPGQKLALKRFAAISWVQQRVAEGLTLAQALREAAARPWPDAQGSYYSWATLEELYYLHRKGGFEALHPRGRRDKECFRKMAATTATFILEQVRAHPTLSLSVHYRLWKDSGHILPSVATVYRFLRCHGLDARSLRRGRLDTGPTKSFEAPHVNDLWMTDFSPGPVLVLEDGKRLSTHLCVIIDDHSRLLCYAAYYPRADTRSFHDALKQALMRRGKPLKLYTDQGKPFVSTHTQIICANLGFHLIHAKPYAAWSKGKVERVIYTIQADFEASVRLPERRVASLEALNEALSHWITTVYHQRAHSSTGATPHERYQAALSSIRSLDAHADIDRLFRFKVKRVVRRDGTISIDNKRYEVDLCLRALQVEVFYDPFNPLSAVEIFCQNRSYGNARLVNLHLNSLRS